MIVGRQTYPLEVPHEPGNVIVIRELSGLEMDDAKEIASRKSIRKFAEMGDVLQQLRSARTQEEEEQLALANKEIDQKTLYDWPYLLSHGIVSWSGSNYDGTPCDSDNKLLLDKVTMEWILDEIVNRNTVPAGEL